MKQNLHKNPFQNKFAARVHTPATFLQTSAVCALIRRFHNGIREKTPFSCLARLVHWLLWLLFCCCNNDPHKNKTPTSQMSNYGSEISNIYRKPMLGTQRDVNTNKTFFDKNGLLVLVYNRTKTKSKDQISKKTLKNTTPLRVWGKIQSESLEKFQIKLGLVPTRITVNSFISTPIS